jgi:dTDP-4-amino-4,6-dideoxygalactose transaminase
MNVPFLRFDEMHQPLRGAFLEATARVIDSSAFILGPHVEVFEREFAAYCGTSRAIGVGNGLEALHLALRVFGIGPGDEVIVPANTYIATVLAVSYTGATPVLAEPRETTCNLDPEAFRAAITPRTKAVIPVHLYGQICEMEAIMAIAGDHGLRVIEDNAQAQGARYQGKRSGSWGHLNATSFYPGKNIGALGDGGALTTDDPELARSAQMWRNYGSEQKYYNQVRGYNSRLDELQAAFLSIKLERLDTWNAERQRLAANYQDALSGIGGLTLPVLAAGAESVWHLYVVRSARRDALQAHLTARGIGSLIHYPIPPHRQEAYRDLGWNQGQFPLSEAIAETALSLPLFPGLREEEQAAVIDAVKSFFR